MWLEMRKLAGIVLATLFLATGPSFAARDLPRVASVNICGDQFLMMLADPSQIASLSWQSSSDLSFFAADAAAFLQNRGTAEELLDQDIDVLVLADYGDQQLKKIMTRFGVQIVELPLSEEFSEVEETVRRVAGAIGRTEQGGALIDGMEERLSRVARETAVASRPRGLYFRSDGGGAGLRTFVHTAMETAGFRNLQAELGDEGWRTLPFEHVVMSPPDVFVTSFFDSPYASVRSAFRYHPVFWHLAKDKPLIQVPGKYWPCASPLLVNAVEHLLAERLATGIDDEERGQ